ncbi:hypothetical protein LOTGIDRAFT_152435 [Lottia gigantea]|uniref:Uncharacterized protein n=1 Tax=Lottia gigantea TaxID=225164 RepID=V4B4Z7_LOTGI|nr:hypothetical protein LOTGIDRAFT_152435 [Lottia gigantea]ESP05578.1 hypothetical protein LOTGIDRAFT_152435 [Lottia gigantea]
MGCGSSSSTKQENQPKSQSQKGAKGKERNARKKGDFEGVRSIDFSENASEYYGQTHRSHPDTSRFPDGIAYIYGFKAKLKRQLKECTQRGSLEKIEDALKKYEKYDGPEDDDYFRAIDRRYFLQVQRGLRDGMRRRHAGTLTDAINNAKNSPYQNKLRTHIAAAEKLRDHIVELEIHTHDVLDMEQKTVSEIKSYQRPPDCIFYTMKSTYVLLNTDPDKMQDWGDIQGLMNQTNKNGLMYKVDNFDLDDAKLDNALKAEKILDNCEYGDVLKASNGAAIFYLWANQNINQIKEDNKKTNNNNNSNKRKKR